MGRVVRALNVHVLLVVVGLLGPGCLKQLGPDLGPEQTLTDPDGGTIVGGCNDADSDPAVTVSFTADIRNGVFNRGRCNNCHTGSGEGLQTSGLDLASYITLRAGGGRSMQQIVINDMPCASILYQKIGPAPPWGKRMPRNRPPLVDADIQLVHDWIAEGAHDN